jgi:hypothetical protein
MRENQFSENSYPGVTNSPSFPLPGGREQMVQNSLWLQLDLEPPLQWLWTCKLASSMPSLSWRPLPGTLHDLHCHSQICATLFGEESKHCPWRDVRILGITETTRKEWLAPQCHPIMDILQGHRTSEAWSSAACGCPSSTGFLVTRLKGWNHDEEGWGSQHCSLLQGK